MTAGVMPISISDDADGAASEAYAPAVDAAIGDDVDKPDAGPLAAAVAAARRAAARAGL